jgi:hypothetical protein
MESKLIVEEKKMLEEYEPKKEHEPKKEEQHEPKKERAPERPADPPAERASRPPKFAVIQIWERGLGFGKFRRPQPRGEVYEEVNWFESLHEATRFFTSCPQGQTTKAGERNRQLVQILKQW